MAATVKLRVGSVQNLAKISKALSGTPDDAAMAPPSALNNPGMVGGGSGKLIKTKFSKTHPNEVRVAGGVLGAGLGFGASIVAGVAAAPAMVVGAVAGLILGDQAVSRGMV